MDIVILCNLSALGPCRVYPQYFIVCQLTLWHIVKAEKKLSIFCFSLWRVMTISNDWVKVLSVFLTRELWKMSSWSYCYFMISTFIFMFIKGTYLVMYFMWMCEWELLHEKMSLFLSKRKYMQCKNHGCFLLRYKFVTNDCKPKTSEICSNI